ncbi:TonB-dependent receptor [uncultured Aquimarina sp.]|uniref:TonB-dependent receptor domain-containing protein n=1 Tax=uncultured Aquimarina sp. TaxID=575652 RepID=UPI00260369DB|nr:TonB-dependent receptor [uncultured Aquimarina sp.]
MKKLIFIFLLIPFLSISQVEVTGKVKDKADVIVYANVILTNESGQIVNGAITDEKGSFTINIPKGTYTLLIKYLGYEDYKTSVVLDENKVMNDIVLNEKSSNLEEVVIVSKKRLIEQKVDRLVFNIADNVATSGGDALDALRVSPGIAVNDDQITMIGKSGMRVMVDGRIIQMSGEELNGFLSSIPADDIKEIEIITNPPAKYEAEGNSGLINIVYKRGKNNSWNNTTSLTYTQAIFSKYALRNNFTYQKDKVKLLLSLNAGTGNKDIDQRTNIFYTDGPWDVNVNQNWNEDNISGRLMLDYAIGKNSTIGVQYLGSISKPDIVDKTTATIFDNSNTIESVLISNGFSDQDFSNHSVNAHFKTKLDTLGRSVSVDLDYFDYNSDRDRNIVTEDFLANNMSQGVSFSNETNTSHFNKNYSGKVDIEHPFEKLDLSYGAKISVTDSKYETANFNTITGVPVLDPSQSDEFEYTENNQALYVNGSKKINERWETQLGLRLENTQTEGFSKSLNRSNDLDYLKLFPTFYLSYNMNDNNSFSFNYGRRINRPGYSQLNPARYYVNNNTFSTGNPFLQPSFDDNIELSHNYKGKFITKLFFSYESDGFGVISSVDDTTNEQMITFENFYDQYNYGLSEFYTFNPISWWRSQNSLYLLQSESKIFNQSINAQVQNGFRYYVATNNTFTLNKSKTIRSQINFWYSSPFERSLYKYEDNYKLDIALKFSLMEKSLNASLGVYDVLNTSPRQQTSFINDIKQTYIRFPSNRYFRMSLTYNFGNKKIRVRQRHFGNEDEKRRAGN